MRFAIVLAAALAPPLPARADTSAPAAAAACGGERRARLARALVEYCEHERRADACTCHRARRALRCEPDAPSKIVDNINNRGGDLLLLVPERCRAWRVYFERGPRGWRVDHVDDDPECS